MPVVPVTSGASADFVAGNAATGSTTTTLNVNPNANDLFAVAGLLWTGGVDASGATFGVTFDGDAMTEHGSKFWNSSNDVLKAYILDDPNSGTGLNVVGSLSGMPATELVTRDLTLIVGVYSGVDSAGDAVTAGNSSPMNNTVAVSSVAEAHRPVFFHAVSGVNAITGYNQITRQHKHAAGIFGGDLLLGDAAGAATVTSTATGLTTAFATWGAIGFNLIPAPVMVDVVLYMSGLAMEARAGLFRTATPPPDRFYKIPGNLPVNS